MKKISQHDYQKTATPQKSTLMKIKWMKSQRIEKNDYKIDEQN
jgi:hypothetical protein